MSLNHLVSGGSQPPQNITVNNLNVDGTLTTTSGGSVTRTGDYSPSINFTSGGPFGGSVNPATAINYWSNTGNQWTVHSTIDFETGRGAGATWVTIGLDLPPGVTIPGASPVSLVQSTFEPNITLGQATQELVTNTVLIFNNEMLVTLSNPTGIEWVSDTPYRFMGVWNFEYNP